MSAQPPMDAPPCDMSADSAGSEKVASIRESLSHMVAPDESVGYRHVCSVIPLLAQLSQLGDASAQVEFDRLRALADVGTNMQVVEGMADYYAFSHDTEDQSRLKAFGYGSVLLRKGHSYNVYRMLPMFLDPLQFGLDYALDFTGQVLQLCSDVQLLLDKHQIPETFEVDAIGCCYSSSETVQNDQHFLLISALFARLTEAFPREFLPQVETRFQDDRKPFRDLMLAMHHAPSESESDSSGSSNSVELASQTNMDKAWPFLLDACKAGLPYALTEFAQPRWRTRAVLALAHAT